MIFAFFSPKMIGKVRILLVSFFIALMSKGIVIAKTNKNLEIKSEKTSMFKTMFSSIITAKTVVIDHIREIRNIFKYWILLR